MASAGLYASLHLAPDRQPHQHPTTLVFLQAGCPSCRPTNSVKALKAQSTEGTRWSWRENQWHILPWFTSDLAAACHTWDLWQVSYLPASQNTSTPSMQDYQLPGMGDIHVNFVRYMSLSSPNVTDWKMGRSAAAILLDGSEWRRWTETVSDCCLGWIGTKHHRQLNW